MGGEANSNGHAVLDQFLNTVLDHYKDGVISWRDAHETLSTAFSLAGGRQDASVTNHMQSYLSRDPREGL